MISALCCALNARAVSAVLVAVGVAVASIPRDRIDPAAVEAEALRPLAVHPEWRGFRFPAPGDYPLEHRPWIKSRADLIASLTRGEDPEVVRRYSEGPEEELIRYLGEVFDRACHSPPGSPPGRRE